MRVLFYLDHVMHYHVATFQELERRIDNEGGEFTLVSGQKRPNESGRVAISHPIVRRHLFIPSNEWIFGTYTLRWQPTLLNAVRKSKPDVLVVAGHVGDLTYWRLGSLRQRMGFKYVTWQCGYEHNPGTLKDVATGKFLRRYDYHLAYHSNAKKYLISHGVSESRIMVIHNTINEKKIGLLSRDKARQMVTDELQLRRNRPIILYVGAILPEKRVHVLLDAVRRLAPRIPASLIIVGDGTALADLKSASAGLEWVKYTGRVVKGVGRFFDAADVFVLPGMGGLAINEPMAHGLPVISSFADGSATDLITDGVNGYVLNLGEPVQYVGKPFLDDAHADEIAAHLEAILGDAENSCRMGTASRHLITTKYSFEAFIDRILKGLNEAYSDATTFSRAVGQLALQLST